MEETIKKPLNPNLQHILDLLKDPSKIVVVQTAPAVRVSLGESFGLPIGSKVTGKMVASLRKIGFKYVFDTDFGADITIWEEANEFYNKLVNNEKLPMFTSCCIGWLNMASKVYKDVVMPLISTTKSPIGCLGAIVKTYFAEKNNFDPKNIVNIAVVPCVLKAQENVLPYNKVNGIPDVDICITTKDLASIIQYLDIDFNSLNDEEFDNPLGESSGGGTIFGRSGGVMEAAVRSAMYIDNKTIFTSKIPFKPSSYSPDIMEASVTIAGKEVNICHCGMMGVRKIVDLIKSNQCPYHFVEVMACPGGCVMGAGQPVHLPKEGVTPIQVRQLRANGLNDIEANQEYRVSMLNPSAKKVYDEYFEGKPGSHKAEEILHRDYSAK